MERRAVCRCLEGGVCVAEDGGGDHVWRGVECGRCASAEEEEPGFTCGVCVSNDLEELCRVSARPATPPTLASRRDMPMVRVLSQAALQPPWPEEPSRDQPADGTIR